MTAGGSMKHRVIDSKPLLARIMAVTTLIGCMSNVCASVRCRIPTRHSSIYLIPAPLLHPRLSVAA